MAWDDSQKLHYSLKEGGHCENYCALRKHSYRCIFTALSLFSNKSSIATGNHCKLPLKRQRLTSKLLKKAHLNTNNHIQRYYSYPFDTIITWYHVWSMENYIEKEIPPRLIISHLTMLYIKHGSKENNLGRRPSLLQRTRHRFSHIVIHC